MYAPNGNVRFGGLYTADASRCPSTPSGSASDGVRRHRDLGDAARLLGIAAHPPLAVRPTPGRPAATSSIAAATIRARSRTFRAAMTAAAPDTGVDREP